MSELYTRSHVGTGGSNIHTRGPARTRELKAHPRMARDGPGAGVRKESLPGLVRAGIPAQEAWLISHMQPVF